MAACQTRRALVAGMAPAAYVAVTIACWSVAVPTVHGQESTAAEQTAMTPRNDRVVLPAAKIPFVGLKTQRIGTRRLQPTRVAPGRLRYDERRHVEVKTAAAGIIRQILVKPGDRVEAGDLLAVVTSAEVGQIRADLMRLTAVRDLAVKRLERARAIEEGVNRLVDQIASEVDPREAANQVEKNDLGEYRAPLLSAYAAWRLAEALYRNGEVAGGSLSGRQLEERRSEYVAAQGALRAAIEQAVFNTELASLEAENRVADAERRVAISAQYAAALQGAAAVAADSSPSELSELRLLAPIAGTIELQRFRRQRANCRGGRSVCRGRYLSVMGRGRHSRARMGSPGSRPGPDDHSHRADDGGGAPDGDGPLCRTRGVFDDERGVGCRND